MAPGTGTPERRLLEVRDLSVAFDSPAGTVRAVRGLSYDVAAGDVLGVVGETGSGKTVSSLAIMQLLPPHARVSGSVRFHGEELLGKSDADLSAIRGRKIAMIFQDPLSALTPVYTVGDQIAEAVLVHNRVSREAARDRAIELLALVGIPNPRQRAASFPHEFSGGMRQRVMIAMAIANDPDLIIADEPTTALDVTIQAQILDVLRKAKEATGAAIILITHDLGMVAGFADRVCVMYAGKPVETGAVDDVFYRPRMPYTLGLLGSIPRLDEGRRQRLTPIDGAPPPAVNLPPGCPFVPRCPMSIERCLDAEPQLLPVDAGEGRHHAACHRSGDIERDNLTSADVFPSGRATDSSRRVDAHTHRGGPSGPPSPTVLEVHGLVKEFPVMKGAVLRRRVGTVHAVDGISFELHEGETLGLVGESGCGKTTTLMEILSLATPAAGRIVVLGQETTSLTRAGRFAIRRDLQVVFQDPMASLDPRMPIGDIIAEPMETHGVPPADRISRVRELLELVGLRPEHASRFPQAFSGGQRQRIGIARALALRPRVLVLDEPVSALDVSVRAGILNLLEDLKGSLGLSYLFVSHDLSVVRYVADRVAVMYLGRFVEIGDVATVFDRPAHPYTQALLSAIPLPDPQKERSRRRIVLEGDLPNPADPPSGCRFRTRCQKFAGELTDAERQSCIQESPALRPRTGDPGRLDACHYAKAEGVV
ncbi:MAG TPA: ABC transporter ATP-binding protein [Vicinamibacterales bacterium]|nr:ABC transporter ATP-binding protein [Vicinamibacterales bacterium]